MGKVQSYNFRKYSPPPHRHSLILPPLCLAGELDLELGAGTGDFSIAYCLDNPGRHLLSIEKTKEKFARFEKKAHEAGLKNLTLMHANATHLMLDDLPKPSIKRVFLLYPNPYPKVSQANKRWHRMPFFEYLLGFLKPGATLESRTNLLWYHQDFLEVATQGWGLEFVEEKEITQPAPDSSAFERKYLLRGETCYFTRVRVSTPLN